MSKLGKHHYIPVFYLKQWTGSDEKVCEFKRRYHGVQPRRVHPDATGYVHGLNTVSGLPPSNADFLETDFMQLADNYASRALRILLAMSPWKFTDEERSGWSRFIVSLITRNPESVERHKAAGKRLFDEARADIEADYAARRLPTDPATYEEYAAKNSPNPAGRAGAILLQKVIDNPQIGNWINQMRWIVLHDARPKHLLLTSDRPVVMTNGIAQENAQLILPISPHHAFVATNNLKTENYIRDVWHRREAIEQVNDRVTKQSHKFVYGFDDSQLDFVSKRLGLKYTADPLESRASRLSEL